MIVYKLAKKLTPEDDEWRFQATAHISHWGGPYMYAITRAKWNGALPSPDGDEPPHQLQNHEVCGCVSIDQLLEWFAEGLRQMETEGFRLLSLDVPDDSCNVLEKQVVFVWADAVIVNEAAPTTLLEQAAAFLETREQLNREKADYFSKIGTGQNDDVLEPVPF